MFSTTFLVFVLGSFAVAYSSYEKCSSPVYDKRTAEDLVNCIDAYGYLYDYIRRPNATGSPVRIKLDLVILTVGNINEAKMDFSIEFYMRQKWNDPDLRFSQNSLKNKKFIVLSPRLIWRLWKPDTYIENLKSLGVYNYNGPIINEGLRLFPNGDVLFSSRISAVLTCHMDFRLFPMDKHVCPIIVSSYFFTEDDLIYEWNEFSMYGDVRMSQFDISRLTTSRKTLSFTSGAYSSLKAFVHLRRRIQSFLFRYYLPAVITVALSWLGFWISPQSPPSRIFPAIITVLAMAAFVLGDKKSFPAVSYLMAIEIYIITCYIFVFGALLECAVVHYFYFKDYRVTKIGPHDEGDEVEMPNTTQVKPLVLNESDNITWEERFNVIRRLFFKPKRVTVSRQKAEKALRVDKVSRFLFPIMFLLFNLGYWLSYKEALNDDTDMYWRSHSNSVTRLLF